MIKVRRFIAAALLIAIAGLGIEYVEAVTGGLISGNAQSSINGITGPVTTGAGLSTNQNFVNAGVAPWSPYNSGNNVLSQTTGDMNVIRNASLTSYKHLKYLTQENPASNPYTLGIASFTASVDNGTPGVAGNRLEVSGTPTGTIQLFQEVNDLADVQLPTNQATAAASASCPSASASCIIHFGASAPGVNAGMYVTDLTTPRAIAGNIKVSSVSGGDVTLTGPVGFTANGGTIGAPGVASGDQIAFTTLLRGTEIVGGGSCQPTLGTTPTYPCYWLISGVPQNVASETMSAAGGFIADNVYVRPQGTAGTGNYLTCSIVVGLTGSRTSAIPQCNVTGTLTDVIISLQVDWSDAIRLNCALYSPGAGVVCVSSGLIPQAVTFQLYMLYSANVASVPTLDTKNACPQVQPNTTGANLCKNVWTTATTDLWVPTGLSACNSGAATPIECVYAYTWVPNGITGNMEINYHTHTLTAGQYIAIDGFELKQTPGAQCVSFPGGTYTVSSPPCLNFYPGPLEIPSAQSDIVINNRFTQTLGAGLATAWNASNKGPIETTSGVASSATTFIASWTLQGSMYCDFWTNTGKQAPTCPVPNVYFPANVSGYLFDVYSPSNAEFTATSLATGKIGDNTLQIIATSSGLTAGTAGQVQWIPQNGVILIDSASIGAL